MKPNYVKFQMDNSLDQIVKSLELINLIAKESNINFDPMEPHQIHMTVVFLGNIMKGMQKQSRDKLIQTINSFDLANDELFTFEGFDFFGNNNNLLIAKFSVKKTIINKIIEFKKQFTQFGAIQEDFFVPHITLGKVSTNVLPNNFCSIIKHIQMPNLKLNKVLLV